MEKSIQPSILEFQKILSTYKSTGRISECFYHDKTKCNGSIKQSHSIQRNGRLSIIEGIVNANSVVYSFTETEISETTSHKSLIPIGKAKASTFFGFCDHHDTTLFSPIENHSFDESDKHCFLHSYRSFAHSYHRKIESYKAMNTDSKYSQSIPPEILNEMKESVLVGINDMNIGKLRIDELIENSIYDELEYLTYIIPEKFPIACSSVISPFYSYCGIPINNHGNPEIPYSIIMLTVLPDHESTIIIMACFNDDSKGVLFLDELDKLYPYQFKKAISSIMINCAENTFFAPALWEKLGDAGQRTLCTELEKASSNFHIPTKFEISKINFFDQKFSAKSLGI
jgi:hypothetical protein